MIGESLFDVARVRSITTRLLDQAGECNRPSFGAHASTSTPGGTSITFEACPQTSTSTFRDVRRADERCPGVGESLGAPRRRRLSDSPRIEYSSSDPCALTAKGAPAAAPTGPPSST